jgi:hypothetical protein
MHKLLVALVATLNLTQALVLSRKASDIEPSVTLRNDNIPDILARAAPVCNRTNSKQCKTCVNHITLTKGAKCDPKKQKCPTKPSPTPNAKANPTPHSQVKPLGESKPEPEPKPQTSKKTCKPKPGKPCKREVYESEESFAPARSHDKDAHDKHAGATESQQSKSSSHESESTVSLAARAETSVRMMDTRATAWGPGDIISTPQLSVCSVVTVWDQNRVIMAHIPPGEPTANGDVMDSTATIRLYLGRIDAEMARAPLVNPKGAYLLASDTLPTAAKEVVRNWAVGHGITLQTRSYGYRGPPGAKFSLTRAHTGTEVTDTLENPMAG